MSQNITRRTLLSATALLATGALSACGGNGDPASDSVAVDSPVTLTVAASPSPHAEILNDFAAPLLAEQGITLEVKEYTDYILPNQDTTSGEVDCNYFQHLNYLNNYNEENGTDLVSVGKIHFEPMGVFAGKSDDLAAIADGATITIPNDATNEGRALLLLQEQGIITLSEDAGITATPNDIVDNPHNVEFHRTGGGDAAVHPCRRRLLRDQRQLRHRRGPHPRRRRRPGERRLRRHPQRVCQRHRDHA